jgi:hypothetical protein
VGEFDPAIGQLTEYPVSSSTYEGVYQLALDRNGNLWFVELQGGSIGELVRSGDLSPISVTLPTSATVAASGGSVTIPIMFSEPKTAANQSRISLSISGISRTGALQNMTSSFSPSSVALAPGEEAGANLTLATSGLSPGAYDLTFTAQADQGLLHSVVLRLTVTGGGALWILPAVFVGVAGAAMGILALSMRIRKRKVG